MRTHEHHSNRLKKAFGDNAWRRKKYDEMGVRRAIDSAARTPYTPPVENRCHKT
jgi:hypothetical protein